MRTAHPVPARTLRRRRRPRRPVLAGALIVGLLAGCTGSDGSAGGDLTVTDATIDWPANPDIAAVRLTISNGTDADDLLTGASSSTGEATIHRSATDAQGRSTMKPLDQLEVPAGKTVVFEAGDLHVMLEDPAPPLEIGDAVTVTLDFERAGSRSVTAEVIEPGTGDDVGGHDG